jgi:hypothetical protein
MTTNEMVRRMQNPVFMDDLVDVVRELAKRAHAQQMQEDLQEEMLNDPPEIT